MKCIGGQSSHMWVIGRKGFPDVNGFEIRYLLFNKWVLRTARARRASSYVEYHKTYHMGAWEKKCILSLGFLRLWGHRKESWRLVDITSTVISISAVCLASFLTSPADPLLWQCPKTEPRKGHLLGSLVPASPIFTISEDTWQSHLYKLVGHLIHKPWPNMDLPIFVVEVRGNSRPPTLNLWNHALMEVTFWTRDNSCWNRKGPSSNCYHKVENGKLSFLVFTLVFGSSLKPRLRRDIHWVPWFQPHLSAPSVRTPDHHTNMSLLDISFNNHGHYYGFAPLCGWGQGQLKSLKTKPIKPCLLWRWLFLTRVKSCGDR